MEFEILKSAGREITMPDEMKQRILVNCKEEIVKSMEEYTMSNRNRSFVFRRPATVFAILAVCLSFSVSALAATGVLQGVFRDITDFTDAITGTSYEQATDEISIRVAVDGDNLTVVNTFSDPGKFPYRTTERFGIAEYKIIDSDGQVVRENETAASAPVTDGQAALVIDLGDLKEGSYKLIVSSFVSEKKADQPLPIHGYWECEFTK